jgi:predicted RNase H-like nuclease (RuvC/YqgF family)
MSIFKVSASASTFIQRMKQLQAYMLKHLSTSFQECARERYLQRLCKHNEQVKAEISVLTTKLEEQNRDIQLKLTAKNLLVNQHEAKIERLNRKCEENLKKRA